MGEFAKLDAWEIIHSHQFLTSMYKQDRDIAHTSDRLIKQAQLTRNKLIAYDLFAKACYDLELNEIEYYYIKKIIVHELEENQWQFEYEIKRGIFSKKEKYKFIWDEELDHKLDLIFKPVKRRRKR